MWAIQLSNPCSGRERSVSLRFPTPRPGPDLHKARQHTPGSSEGRTRPRGPAITPPISPPALTARPWLVIAPAASPWPAVQLLPWPSQDAPQARTHVCALLAHGAALSCCRLGFEEEDGRKCLCWPQYSPRGLAGQAGLHCLSVQVRPAEQRECGRGTVGRGPPLGGVQLRPPPGPSLTTGPGSPRSPGKPRNPGGPSFPGRPAGPGSP